MRVKELDEEHIAFIKNSFELRKNGLPKIIKGMEQYISRGTQSNTYCYKGEQLITVNKLVWFLNTGELILKDIRRKEAKKPPTFENLYIKQTPTGISFDQRFGIYVVMIKRNYKYYYGGRFKTIEEAEVSLLELKKKMKERK